jgi:DNA-binding NtrC family response regulator
MKSVIFIETQDINFTETLSNMLGRWGLSALQRKDGQSTLDILQEKNVDVVLLDIRHPGGSEINLLLDIKKTLPDTEVIIINKTDNIKTSMEAMQAGADDEIIAPCDSSALQKKINEACGRRKKQLRKKGKRSFSDMFSDVMSAAVFAQAGEFDTAVELMNGETQEKPEEKKREI